MDYNQAFPSDKYLKGLSFLDNRTPVMIKEVRKELVEDHTRPQEQWEEKVVIYFHYQKPMICNKTNFKAIATVMKTSVTEKWHDRIITLTGIIGKFFGIEQPALRVFPSSKENVKGWLLQAATQKEFKERYALVSGKITKEKAQELWREKTTQQS